MRAARTPATKVFALVVFIIVILVATPQAQQTTSFTGSPGAVMAGPAAELTDATNIDLLVGRSTILNVGSPISRVSLTVPDIADAMVTTPQQLLIHGKAPGTISMFVWDKAGGIKTYEVVVRRDLTRLVEQAKQLFPGEPIVVTGSGKEVVLSGTVSSKYVVDKAAEVATGYVEKKEDVVNLLKQQEGVASNQVMLRVRFAEVSRSALQELGVNLFTGPTGYKDWIARSTTQQFAAPNYTDLSRTATLDDKLTSASGKYSLSDFLNLFLFNNKYNIGTVIRAWESKGLFQSLAEPNLIALNGKEASFLAGGEYPYPVAQPSQGGGTSVTIQFKEFGIRLNFTPTVLGDNLISLKVRPEVSSLDFTNAIVLDGFRLPALSTRRTDTEVELQDGQTFAIAGLLNNNLNNTMQKIPGIGDIPILGYLFKSRAYQKNQTELVVMITPTIVKRGSIGVSEGLPSLVEPYLQPPSKTYPNQAPYTGSPRYPVTEGAKPQGGQAKQDDNPAPQAAASQPQPQAPAPVAQAARPAVQQPASSVKTVQAESQPQPAASAQPDAPATRPLSKEEMKRIERARAEEKKQADAAAKAKAEADRKAAEQKKLDDEQAARDKAEADRKAQAQKEQQDRLDAERARREAVVAKKNAEIDKKKQEEQKKHDKALADAAARLKQAQAEYQAQLEKAKSNDQGTTIK